jgi:LmbE family N-acetylglucosaminyl deacetylase
MNEPHSLAVVVAHPDDDAYGCAGSIALHENDPGFRFCLVLATDGGGGQIAAGVPTTPHELGAWRRRESANAWRAHGRIPDRHEWLDYADGQVAEADFEELVGRILAVLLEERPQVWRPSDQTESPGTVTISPSAGPPMKRSTGHAERQAQASAGWCTVPCAPPRLNGGTSGGKGRV